MPFTVPEVPLRWAPTRKGLLEPAQRVHRYDSSAAAAEAAESGKAAAAEADSCGGADGRDEVEDGQIDEAQHRAAREAEEELRRCKLPHIVNRIEKKSANNYPSLIFSGPESYESLVAWLGTPYKPGDFRLRYSECESGWALEKELADIFMSVSGDPDHDLPYDAQVNSKNVWQWSRDDWTVTAQPYNPKYPWRPFCEGPPGSATDTSLTWATLTPADCVIYFYRKWHGLTRARVRPTAGRMLALDYDRAKNSIVALLPQCELPFKTYDELVPAWTRDFSLDVLDRPMEMLFHQLSWLRLQRKLRDLKGIANYLTAHVMVEGQAGRRTKVDNFVGVRFDPEWSVGAVANWAFQGVAVLEPVWSIEEGKLVLRRHSEEFLREMNKRNGAPENTAVLEWAALNNRQRQSRMKGSSSSRNSKKRKAAAMEHIAQGVRPLAETYAERFDEPPVAKTQGDAQYVVPDYAPDDSTIGLDLPQPNVTHSGGTTPADSGRDDTWDQPAFDTWDQLTLSTWDQPAGPPEGPSAYESPLSQVVVEAAPKRKLTWQELAAERKAKKAAEMAASACPSAAQL